MLRSLYQWTVTLLVIAYIAVGVFGVGMAMSTTDGSMADCPLSEHGSGWCPMTAFDHVASWQSLFSAPLEVFWFVVVMLCVGGLSTVAMRQATGSAIDPPPWQFVYSPHFFQPLTWALQRGIVHRRVPRAAWVSV